VEKRHKIARADDLARVVEIIIGGVWAPLLLAAWLLVVVQLLLIGWQFVLGLSPAADAKTIEEADVAALAGTRLESPNPPPL
jgi:hypothetical protein